MWFWIINSNKTPDHKYIAKINFIVFGEGGLIGNTHNGFGIMHDHILWSFSFWVSLLSSHFLFR